MNDITQQKRFLLENNLPGDQEKIDVAEPKGKITAADFKKLRATNESGDHEVGMAIGSLEQIVQNATELLQKLGSEEKNIPGWIQDHITNSEHYIYQANKGYHELEPEEASIMEGNPNLIRTAIRDTKNILKNAELNKDSVDVKVMVELIKKYISQIEQNL